MWDHMIQDHDPDASNYGNPSQHPERVNINGDRDAPEMSAEDLERVKALGYVPEDMDLDGVSVRPSPHERRELQRDARPDRYKR